MSAAGGLSPAPAGAPKRFRLRARMARALRGSSGPFCSKERVDSGARAACQTRSALWRPRCARVEMTRCDAPRVARSESVLISACGRRAGNHGVDAASCVSGLCESVVQVSRASERGSRTRLSARMTCERETCERRDVRKSRTRNTHTHIYTNKHSDTQTTPDRFSKH